jgi:hypothetical protein
MKTEIYKAQQELEFARIKNTISFIIKILILFIFSVNLVYGQPGCIPGFGDNYGYINHFEFNSLFNIRSGENGDYTLYDVDEYTTSVTMGETYSIQVASESTPVWTQYTAWIDFDNDGYFEPGEVVLNAHGVPYVNEMITIPTDPNFLGLRRLRVMVASNADTLNPCGYYNEGEAEEYFITITDSYVEPCYCTPFIQYDLEIEIKDFKVGEILNCNSDYNPFSYFTFYPDSLFSTDLEIGKTYRILISKGTFAGVSVGVRAYIDFNNDHVFSPSESILEESSGGIVDSYFTVPNDSNIIGEHRLRVRINHYYIPGSGCMWTSGETEDYMINIVAQDTNENYPDWQKIIHLPNSQGVYDIKETYDKGFALSLVEGPDMDEFRLIKFSINGDTLWSKFPASDESNYPLKMHETFDGGFIVCGLTLENEPDGDPYAMKLDACGDLQWKKTYGNQMNYDYASHILQSSDSNYIVLVKYLSDTSRIALFKLDSIGNIIWQNDFTHHMDSEPEDLIETSDKGYLITGTTYTPNPGDSSAYWVRSMVIKVDSTGNEQWEKVLGITDTTVSVSLSSVELESGEFLIPTSSLDLETNKISLGVYKIDNLGNLLSYKRITSIPDKTIYGNFILKMENNKFCIVSSIYCGCFDNTAKLGLFMIDSEASVLDSAFINDYYLVIQGAVITENNKIVVSGSEDFPDDYDIFMYKFNENLEFDSLYSINLNYDSLCDLIIFQPELSKDNFNIKLFPNPTCQGINIQIIEPKDLEYLVEILNINGLILKIQKIKSNELKYLSLDDLNSGTYFITISQNNQFLSSRKIVKLK